MSKTLYLIENTSDKLKSLLNNFEQHLKETERGNSVRSYLGDVHRFTDWAIEKYSNFNPQAVSPLDLIQYRQRLQGEGKAPATINRALISLKVFLSWLVKQGVIKDSPVEDIKLVAVAAKPVPKWIDRNQQAALMRAVREGGRARDEAMIGIMLHAGLRVSEICALERVDIYISDRAGKVAVRKGKGNKYREVPLNKTIRKIISRWLEENPEGPLFPNRRKGLLTVRGVFGLVSKYAYAAKLPEVTPHTLRHTFCKNAIDLGVPIDQVATMAGHSSLETTRWYTVPSLSDLQAAVERTAWE